MSSSNVDTSLLDVSPQPYTTSAPSAPSPLDHTPSLAVQPAQKHVHGYLWRREETDLLTQLVESNEGSCIDWKRIVKALAEQVPMGGGRARTARQCGAHWWNIKNGNSRRSTTSKLKDSVADKDPTFESGLSAAEKKEYASRRRSSSRIQSQQEPKPPLVSVDQQPFTPEQDEALLELYSELGAAYKGISREMMPRRHKSEVRERLEYLLQPYDFSLFFGGAEVDGKKPDITV